MLMLNSHQTKFQILADERAGMCAFCYRDAFAELGRPVGNIPHMHRMMRVPHKCRRCARTTSLDTAKKYFNRVRAFVNATACTFDSGIDEDLVYGNGVFFPDDLYDTLVEREVFLPTEVLAAANSLVNKSGATYQFGAKPPNDWLQVANLVSQGRQAEDYSYALVTVGASAIIDEITCEHPPVTWYDCFMGLVPDGLMVSTEIGYAWQKYYPLGRTITYSALTGCALGPSLSPSTLGDRSPDVLRDGDRLFRAQYRPLAIQDAAATHEHFEEEDLECMHECGPDARPNVAPPEPDEPPAPSIEHQAAEAALIDEQMGAHVNGDPLVSTTIRLEHGDHVRDNRTADGEVGLRTAKSRFPKTSSVKEYLFSNDPDNLVSAEGMRNLGVGVANLTDDQSKVFDELVDALKKHMFTKARVLKSESYIIKTADVLPKNRTEMQKAQMHIDALNAESDEGVPFSLLVDAFTKKEVSKKPKPRPIANHGNARVWGMARTAGVFEDTMFHCVPGACIKYKQKTRKMNELFTGIQECAYKIENDLTAFEFGIYDRLKQAECDIFKHIMGHLNLDADNAGFCCRVVDARTQACTWVLRYTDAAGAKCCLKLALPRPMRESGDRVTSSGNFLQNLLAWLTLLVKPGKAERAIQSLIKNKGKWFKYVSARDSKEYTAVLAFEGDDTLGSLDERILIVDDGRLINEFFTSYGWKAKLKVASNVGSDCIQFVGYTALLRDGNIVMEGANVVMFPEIKRILQDKPWSSTELPPEEFHPSVAVYATCMANEFKYFAPMHAFFTAMRSDHLAKGGQVRRSNGMLKDLYIKMHGEVGTEEQILNNVPDLEPLLDGSQAYQELARVHAGEYTKEEYACMCGVMTLDMHGRDLACFFPRAWLEA